MRVMRTFALLALVRLGPRLDVNADTARSVTARGKLVMLHRFLFGTRPPCFRTITSTNQAVHVPSSVPSQKLKAFNSHVSSGIFFPCAVVCMTVPVTIAASSYAPQGASKGLNETR